METIKAVDIFCGAGGLTRGLLDAGIDVRAGYDLDEDCRFPYEHNNVVPFHQVDVRELDSASVATELGTGTTLVAGCAPCQPFSILTTKAKQEDGIRAHLLAEFSRIVQEVLPTYVTMENVPGLARRPVFKEFLKGLEDARYDVVHDVLDCSRYGVPQRRQRLVLLASRAGPIDLPPKRPGRAPTVKGAIGKLPPLSAGEIHESDPVHRSADLRPLNLKRIKASKPGRTWEDWPEALRLDCHASGSGKGYTAVYGRMRWDEPAPTVTTKFFNLGSGRFGHPQQDRALTPREAACLQTFGPAYSFVRESEEVNLTRLGRLIGNALPVKLGEAIGKHFLDHSLR